MEDYKSNSHRSKENEDIPQKKLTPVISGTAKPKKKGEMQKFADSLISEDAHNLKSYVVMEVLIPSIKKAISDIIVNGIDMILYGNSGGRRSGVNGSKVSYGGYYQSDRDRRDYSSQRARTGFDYDEIIFNNRGDAEAVLTSMDEAIDKYGVVSVGDLYDLANVSTDNYVVNRYGWTNIRSADVVRARDGYIIKLPKPMPIN